MNNKNVSVILDFLKKTYDKLLTILKKLKPFDFVVIGLIFVAVFVFLITIIGKRMTSSNKIIGNTKIEIDIFFRGVTLTSSNFPFVEGEESFVTIRNVPYTKLKIKSVKSDKKKVAIYSPKSKEGYIIVDDPSLPFQYDFLVTVIDEAKITKDGAVSGGNKIKIGLPITLEGADYKINGTVVNVTKANTSKDAPENIENAILDKKQQEDNNE